MALTRWEPFEGLMSLRREMDRLFEHFFERTPAAMLGDGSTFEPAIEIADIDVLPMAQARGFLGKYPQDFKVDLLGHKTGGLATVQSSGPRHAAHLGQPQEAPGSHRSTALLMVGRAFNILRAALLYTTPYGELGKPDSMRQWTPSTPHADSINLVPLRGNLLLSPWLKPGALRRVGKTNPH